MLNILSLGAGVQSSTVLLMSCRGVLPKLDGAIFADTGWEPPAVYDWLENVLEPAAEKADIPIHRCSKGNIRADALRSRLHYDKEKNERWASMPMFTDNPKFGMLRRQCTKEYKIDPVQQTLRTLSKGKKGAPVTLWFGISSEEKRRMRFSKVRWIEHYYPLIFGLERPWHRQDCLRWMKAQGFPIAPRSACLGCPYHSDEEWAAIKIVPALWNDVVEFDASIRNMAGTTSNVYLHRSLKPLHMVDLESLEDKGQQNWLNECEGMCGV